MSEKDLDKMLAEVEVIRKIRQIDTYLEEHGVRVSDSEIVDAAITLAKRMGAGNWSFVCELKHRKE